MPFYCVHLIEEEKLTERRRLLDRAALNYLRMLREGPLFSITTHDHAELIPRSGAELRTLSSSRCQHCEQFLKLQESPSHRVLVLSLGKISSSGSNYLEVCL